MTNSNFSSSRDAIAIFVDEGSTILNHIDSHSFG